MNNFWDSNVWGTILVVAVLLGGLLVGNIIKKSVQITILVVSMNYGVMTIAFGAVIATLFSCVVNAWPNKKLLDYSYMEQLLDLVPNLLTAGIMGYIVFLAVGILESYIRESMIIVLAIIVGMISYVFLSWIFHNRNLQIVINILKNYRKSINGEVK